MFFDLLISYLYPIYCLGCGATDQWYICRSCHRNLKIHPEICPVCHKFSIDYKVCLWCYQTTPLTGLIIWFHYHDIIKKAILKIKYHHISDIASFFASKLDLILKTNQSIQYDIIHSSRTILTFVPSHRTRKYFVKWYNQSELLAQQLSNLTHYPLISAAYKIKNTKSQANLNRSQRLANLIGAFHVNHTSDLQGDETIIIIDDVTTTGSTINELACSIRAYYPHIRIRWVVVARHVS